MFGKKEEPKLIPMTVYPESTLENVKNNLERGTPIYDVDWNIIMSISIDYITIRPSGPNRFPIEMNLMSGTPTEYIKAWKKGLGRFISKDYSRYLKGDENPNLSKYKFIPFVMKNSEGRLVHLVAFLRFVDEDEIDDFDEMKEYGSISFSYNLKNSSETKNVIVMKIFEKNINMEDEYRLSEKKKIESFDNFYIIDELYNSVYEDSLDEIDDTDNHHIVELVSEDETEFINEESLF